MKTAGCCVRLPLTVTKESGCIAAKCSAECKLKAQASNKLTSTSMPE